ncbi:ABC transporter ATP-binding protein, partial [Candidatus Bipolaricaulota bacterium]|nr:ABC transporter ATP-binding protein [Candidatus Bipolaricaulota bacterium]
MPLLEVEHIHVYYGVIPALLDVSLSVDEGQIVALVGANGAGKSTTLKTIAGVIRPREGQIRFQDQDITRLGADRRVRLGIALVPEGRQIFSTLSVKENLILGAYHRRDQEVKKDLEWVYNLFPILRERMHQVAGTMSGGEQQMLAFGRALMSRPKLLLLDEPSLGLAPLVVRDIYEVIQKIREAGITIFLVEQNVNMAMRVADYMYVME